MHLELARDLAERYPRRFEREAVACAGAMAEQARINDSDSTDGRTGARGDGR